MVLEAVMICVDNSEWMRNGDLLPNRLQSQREAAVTMCKAKIDGNPETDVGILCMAGKRIRTLVTLCRDEALLMASLQDDVKCEGESNLLAGIKTAQLALKNRQNKNQHQRIVAFVGSPVKADVKDLTKLAKKLKKNKIAVDIINFGTENDDNDNVAKLTAFIEAFKSDSSRFLHVSPGPKYLSDVIVSSNILSDSPTVGMAQGVSGAGAAGAAAGANAQFGGVDPNLDPELAMVLRMSMEEERARQQAQAASGGTPSGGATSSGTDASASAAAAAAAAGAVDEDMEEEDDDDALLQQAIAMSMAAEQQDAAAAGAADTPGQDDTAVDMNDEEEEDVVDVLQDPDFIAGLLDAAGDTELAVEDLINDDADKDKKKKKDDKNKKKDDK